MNSDKETGNIMSGIDRQQLLPVLNFLAEKNLRKTLQALKRELGLIFDNNYFVGLVLNGNWDEADRYFSCFTKCDDSPHSMRIFFEIRKQKYLDALDMHDSHKARAVLRNELGVFSESEQELIKETTELLENYRVNRQLTGHAKTEIQRKKLLGKLLDSMLKLRRINNWNGIALQSADFLVPVGQIEPRQTMLQPTINLPDLIRSLTVYEPPKPDMIMRLIYTNSGSGLLALDAEGTNLLWKWPKDDRNPDLKATTMYPPQLWEPEARKQLKNDLPGIQPKDPIHCFALSNNDNFLLSASGGAVTLFNTERILKMADFMRPPPAATCLLFHPRDNNIIIAGMEDSTIQIYHVRLDEVKFKVVGHSRRITGLAFSTELNILVSSAADTEIIVWEYIDEKLIQKNKTSFIQFKGSRKPISVLLDTEIQFHQDQKQFLAVNQLKLGIYESTTELECEKQYCEWRQVKRLLIYHARFSSDSQLVYAAFQDGSVGMFTSSNLEQLCQIHPSAYLPSSLSYEAFPFVIATHPEERNQFALGYSDGRVFVIELSNESLAQRQVLPTTC